MPGEFYIVATPIGNLEDITLRAIETLKRVDCIACEDTRVTKTLAQKYGITAKLFDCHKFNEKERSEKILNLLAQEKKIALVSDAGTPLISDPGSVLIEILLKNNVKITAIPGACAVSTFLSQLPRSSEDFAFIGFIPRNQKQQIEILNKFKHTNCIFYESPNRLISTLENLSLNYGADIKIAVARELTKVFEEVKINSVQSIIEYYQKNPLKGEIAVMVFKHTPKQNDDEINQKIKLLKEENFSAKDISIIISKLYGINKNKVYKLALD